MKEIAAIGTAAAGAAAAVFAFNQGNLKNTAALLEVKAPQVCPILGEDRQEFHNRVIRMCKEACIDAYGDVDGDVSGNGIDDILACTAECRDNVMKQIDEDEYWPE